MTLDEARAEFESGFESAVCGAKTQWAWPGGPEYASVTEAGIFSPRRGAEPLHSALTDDEDEAVRAWLLHAHDHATQLGGRFLIWRVLPEMERYPGHKCGDIDPITTMPYPKDQAPYLVVYSRFTVSDQPLPDEKAA